jgi:hypothetical protein
LRNPPLESPILQLSLDVTKPTEHDFFDAPEYDQIDYLAFGIDTLQLEM